MNEYIKVAISGPGKKSFTYSIPQSDSDLSAGQRLLVPFGNRRKVGFYLGPAVQPTGFKAKPIIRKLDELSLFSKELFDFCLWMSDYYFANPADTLLAALPSIYRNAHKPDFFWNENESELKIDEIIKDLYRPGKKFSPTTLKAIKMRGKTLVQKLIRENIIIEKWPESLLEPKRQKTGYKVTSLTKWSEYFEGNKFQPEYYEDAKTARQLKDVGWTDYQIKKAAYHGIIEPVFFDLSTLSLDYIKPKKDLHQIMLNEQQQQLKDTVTSELAGGFKPFLLHGVTGSGKTIVYCHICQKVLAENKTALILTPEIALTSTTLAYFRGFFGDQVTILHSAMTERERLESYQGIKKGKYKIVVGPRSAIFAPLENLGLIVVDEEHDSSYKQDDPSPRFHGRDAAVMRAKINDVPIILGSASPSFESYYNAVNGRYQLLELTARPGGAVMPVVKIVDMKTERIRGDLPFLSFTLKKDVEDRLQNDEQVILYLNRRGHSSQLKCTACGKVAECPNCQVKLTYHKTGRKLSCHYCGHTSENISNCYHCGQNELLFLGAGTQKVEESLPRLFEGAIGVRLDSDTAAGRNKAYEILHNFAEKKSNLLLGTQMVTKGLDLPDVTLVGVLSADSNLDLPDFRADEKAFSKLLQVSGRSGRSEKKGEVIIQTFMPENKVISDAAAQDYKTFFNREIESRKALGYPPFSRIINFIFSSEDEKLLESAALNYQKQLKQKLDQSGIKYQLLGPAPCPMYYLRKKYRRHLFIKTNQTVKIVKLLTGWEEQQSNFKLNSKVRLNIDVDPDDMM